MKPNREKMKADRFFDGRFRQRVEIDKTKEPPSKKVSYEEIDVDAIKFDLEDEENQEEEDPCNRFKNL